MSQNNGRVKRTEKRLLTPDNCVVAFIDHQPQMLFGTSNFDRQSIVNSTVALAKATPIFDVPIAIQHRNGLSGRVFPRSVRTPRNQTDPTHPGNAADRTAGGGWHRCDARRHI
jgi:hypothetical protein